MYNLKITDYGDEKQISFYPKGINTSIKHDMTKAEKEEYEREKMLSLYEKYYKNDMLALSELDLSDLDFTEVDIEKERMLYVKNHFEYYKQSSRTTPADFENRDALNQARSIRRSIQNIYMLTRANDWNYFSTFTFSDRDYRYDYVTCKQKFSKWMNNFRNRHAGIDYLAVPEQHKDGAWHFHCLIKGDLSSKLVKGVHTNRYILPHYKLGINEFEIVRDRYRVANYITKYITKDLLSKVENKQRYIYSAGLKRPIITEHQITDSYSLFQFIDGNFPEYTMTHQKTCEYAESFIQYIQLRKYDESDNLHK